MILKIRNHDYLSLSYLNRDFLCVFQIKQLNWLPMPLPPHCKVIVTTVKSDVTYVELENRPDASVIPIPMLCNTKCRRQVVEENLASHGKCLNEEQLERIINVSIFKAFSSISSSTWCNNGFVNYSRFRQIVSRAASFNIFKVHFCSWLIRVERENCYYVLVFFYFVTSL